MSSECETIRTTIQNAKYERDNEYYLDDFEEIHAEKTSLILTALLDFGLEVPDGFHLDITNGNVAFCDMEFTVENIVTYIPSKYIEFKSSTKTRKFLWFERTKTVREEVYHLPSDGTIIKGTKFPKMMAPAIVQVSPSYIFDDYSIDSLSDITLRFPPDYWAQ